MTSLKKYTKKQILTEGNQRFQKIASMLDESDLYDMLQQSLSWLDQAIFTPRGFLIKPENIMGYNGGYFVDVTDMKIDVVTRIYYSSEYEGLQGNLFFPEIGLLPYITSGGKTINLSNITDYISVVSNINSMYRQLEMNGDFELWPIDEQGRQLLQLKSNKMVRLEFLPNIDRDADEWYLYDFEYAALKDILFDKCNLFNYEQIMSAQTLGIGKESTNLIDYWSKKLEADKKEFSDKALVTALF